MPEQDIINEWKERKIIRYDTKEAICNFRKKLKNSDDLKNLTVLKARLKITDLLRTKLKPSDKRKITIFTKSIKDLSDNILLDDKQLQLFDSIRRMLGKYLL